MPSPAPAPAAPHGRRCSLLARESQEGLPVTYAGMGLLGLLCVQIAAFSVAEAQEYFGEDPGHVELLSTENFEEKVLEST